MSASTSGFNGLATTNANANVHTSNVSQTHEANPLVKWLVTVAGDTPGKFIVAAYGEGIKEVRHVLNGKEAAAGIVRAIRELQAIDGANVYIMPALMRPDLPDGRKGGIADVVAVLAAVVDFDDDKAADYLNRLPGDPHAVVETSAGRFHCWYFFDKPYSAEAAGPVIKALATQAGADTTGGEVSHIFRVPGCLNIPGPSKLKAGRTVEMAKLIAMETDEWITTSPDGLRAAIVTKWPDAFTEKPREQATPSIATGARVTWTGLRQRLSYIHPTFDGSRPDCYEPPRPKRLDHPLPYDRLAWIGLALCLRDGVPLIGDDGENATRDPEEWLALIVEWSRGELWAKRTREAIVVPTFTDDIEQQLDYGVRDGGTKTTIATLIEYAADGGCPLRPDDEPQPSPSEVFAGYTNTLEPGQDADTPRIEPQAKARFKLRDVSDWQNQEPMQPLISSPGGVFLPSIGTAQIFAQSGALKTFVALAASFSAATGKPLFNRLKVHRTGPAVYFAGEGPQALEMQRLTALYIEHGIPLSERIPLRTVRDVPRARCWEEETEELIKAVRAEFGSERLSQITIDTQARAMAGMNEDKAQDASLFLEMIERLARELQCCVLSVAHEGWDAGRQRGSSAFPAGFDMTWRAEATKEAQGKPTFVELTCEKDKDGEDGEKLYLRSRHVEVPGTARGSLVLDLIDKDEHRRGMGKAKGLIPNADVGKALKALGAFGPKGSPVPTSVLACQLAAMEGFGSDDKVKLNRERYLQREALPVKKDGKPGRFNAYVLALGTGARDPTMWFFPAGEHVDAP